MPTVSVVIPVYNTEKYVSECLDSLIVQTLQDLEIICINDCSTDNSLQILKKYAEKDGRIKLIDLPENHGPAYARNMGIDLAKGEYIGFMDSDDYLESNSFYEKLYTRAIDTNADIAKGAYKNADTGFVDRIINKKIQEDKDNFCSTYCSALFRHSFLKQHDIKFPLLWEMEAPVFAFQCALKANRVETVDDLYYIVRRRNDSLTHRKITLAQIKDRVAGLKQIFSLDENCCHPYVLKFWFSFVVLDSFNRNDNDIRLYIRQSCQELYDKIKGNKAFWDEMPRANAPLHKIFNVSSQDKSRLTLKQIVDQYSVISFDIFDTLLLRPYFKPTDLFLHLERLEKVEGFAIARIEAEKQARRKHINQEDITIDEIYAEIPQKYKDLKSKEMALEKQVLQPNPEMKELFDYAKEKNKRIVIVSDMYLPEKFLSEVLKQKGFDGFEKIYVSCEYRKRKITGNLYKQVLQDLKIKNDEIFHIGDNMISDNIGAEKAKISSIQYTKRIDKLLSKSIYARIFYSQHFDNLEASILLGMMTLGDNTDSYWQEFGYRYAGPAILGYMQWLNNQLIKDHISEVIFLARDGYTMEKVFNLIKTADFKTHYIYAPRVLNPAFHINEIRNIRWNMPYIKELLHYYQDKDDFLQKNTPEIKTLNEGIEFIEDNKDLFLKLGLKEKEIYEKYLKKFKIKDKKVAIVDTDSRLFSGQRIIAKALSDKDITGCYWFVREPAPAYLKIQTFQPGYNREILNWNFMELLMTAPTPPAEKINNGEVIFKNVNEHEEKRMGIYPDISEGAIRFTQKYIDIFGNFGINFSYRTLTNWINIFTQISTPKDKFFFSTLSHSAFPGHNVWRPIFAPFWYQN